MCCKLFALFILVLGEILTLYAEIAAAKIAFNLATVLSVELFRMGLLVMAGSVMLLYGYCLGVIAFGSIWIVTVASIATILIVEPSIAYFLFNEIPTKGALIGLLLGMLGLLVALLF